MPITSSLCNVGVWRALAGMRRDFNPPDVHLCNWRHHCFGVAFILQSSISLDILWVGLTVFTRVVRIPLTPSLLCPGLVFLIIGIGLQLEVLPLSATLALATRHDIEHSRWYKQAGKIVLSKTMHDVNLPKTKIISDNLPDEITKLKQGTGSEILLFGSPAATHSLMAENLIDEYWLFVNPILLGQGVMPLG